VKQATAKKAPNPVDKHVGSRVRMRRKMLGVSQEKLGDGLGLTFQQVQKYEKETNRIGASRLQHISHILQVPVPFFFDGAPHLPGQRNWRRTVARLCCPNSSQRRTGSRSPRRSCGLKKPRLRRRIVDLVEEIAGHD
jgi:transcriptional regulator with XRE-family HTH domain